MLTKSQIKDLKKRLPKPYFQVLADESGMSKRAVSLFFEGKKYYPQVHQAAIGLIEKAEKERQELLSRQKALTHAK